LYEEEKKAHEHKKVCVVAPGCFVVPLKGDVQEASLKPSCIKRPLRPGASADVLSPGSERQRCAESPERPPASAAALGGKALRRSITARGAVGPRGASECGAPRTSDGPSQCLRQKAGAHLCRTGDKQKRWRCRHFGERAGASQITAPRLLHNPPAARAARRRPRIFGPAILLPSTTPSPRAPQGAAAAGAQAAFASEASTARPMATAPAAAGAASEACPGVVVASVSWGNS